VDVKGEIMVHSLCLFEIFFQFSGKQRY